MPETWSSGAPSTKGKIAAAQRLLHEELGRLQSGEDWATYLRLQARFHSYSPNNVCLIAVQHRLAHQEGRVSEPEPTLVAGFQAWRSLGRHVERDQRGYVILAPLRRVVGAGQPDRGGPSPAPDEEPGTHPQPRPVVVSGFRLTHVWDYSQTEGKPLPEAPRPKLLEGAAPAGLIEATAGLLAKRGFDVEPRADPAALGEANGRTDWRAASVSVRADLDQAGRAKTLLHEAAHVVLHGEGAGSLLPRATKEVEAESVAFVVAAAHGMDTSSYSFPYLASWAGSDGPKAVSATQARVAEAAMVLIAASPTSRLGGGRPPGLSVVLQAAGRPPEPPAPSADAVSEAVRP
jgi:hypothetical protein